MSEELIKLLLSKSNGGLGPVAILLLISIVPALLIALTWAGKVIFGFFRDKDDKREQALIALNTTLHENTLALTKLTVQMEYLNGSLKDVQGTQAQHKKDLDGLGEKIRKMERDNGK